MKTRQILCYGLCAALWMSATMAEEALDEPALLKSWGFQVEQNGQLAFQRNTAEPVQQYQPWTPQLPEMPTQKPLQPVDPDISPLLISATRKPKN